MRYEKNIDKKGFYIAICRFVLRTSIERITKKRYIVNSYNKVDFIENDSSQITIIRALESHEPKMIGRLGGNEVNCINQYLRKKFMISKHYSNNMIYSMVNNVGCFPGETKVLDKFAETYLQSIENMDVAGVFNYSNIEEYLLNKLMDKKEYIRLIALDPILNDRPWTSVLEGKRVLVIHPLSEKIEMQYKKRKLLHKNKDILPEFSELIVLKAIQSLGGNDDFKDWKEALEFMCNEIKEIDFDIALVGAGGYGFPIASYIKSIGKKSVHLGGIIQMMFGIKGKRWMEDSKYDGCDNEYWIWPDDKDRPKNYQQVEDGCYW